MLAIPMLIIPSWGCAGDNDGETNAAETNAAETNADETTGSTDGDGLIMNACGTFDPSEPGDGGSPQDPDDPEIIEACTAWCAALSGIDALGACASDTDACVNTCKLRSCGVCPGTLAPLVNCEVDEIDPAACACEGDTAVCQQPAACDELGFATGACGG